MKDRNGLLFGAGVVLAAVLFVPLAQAQCTSTVSDGPVRICAPNTEQPGVAADSVQTPPDIPCWYEVNCTMGTGGAGGGNAHPPVIGSLTATPNPVTYDSAANLSWTTEYTSTCTLSQFGAVPQNGSRNTGSLTQTSTITLTCLGVGTYGGSAVSQAVTIGVSRPAAPTMSLHLSNTQFTEKEVCTSYTGSVQTGGFDTCSAYGAESPSSQVTVTWSSTNATSCTLYKNGTALSSATSGNQTTWAPTATVGSGAYSTSGTKTTDTFTLSCKGPGGQASQSASDYVIGYEYQNGGTVSSPSSTGGASFG